jgi:hypothetical protein
LGKITKVVIFMSVAALYASSPDLIHPEDRLKWDERTFNHCWVSPPAFSKDDDFVPIDVQGECFRVKPAALRVITDATPAFSIGQHVRTTNGTPRIGWIHDFGWHAKYKQFYFFIEVEGKKVPRRRVSRRYWETDLESAD